MGPSGGWSESKCAGHKQVCAVAKILSAASCPEALGAGATQLQGSGKAETSVAIKLK